MTLSDTEHRQTRAAPAASERPEGSAAEAASREREQVGVGPHEQLIKERYAAS